MMIFTNPIRGIAIFAIRFALRSINLPMGYTNLFGAIFTAASTLSRVVGIIPTLRVVWLLRNSLTLPFAGLRLVLTSNQRLNQYVVTTMLTAIEPFWLVASRLVPRLKFFYLIWFTLLPLTLFKPFLMMFARFSIGVLASTVGILWNESLYNIWYLKKGALFISDCLDSHLGFHIPQVSDNSLSKEGSYLGVVGLVLLGFIGILAGICITEYYYPNVLDNSPILGTIAETVNGWFNATYNWIQSWRGAPNVSDTASNASDDTINSEATFMPNARNRNLRPTVNSRMVAAVVRGRPVIINQVDDDALRNRVLLDLYQNVDNFTFTEEERFRNLSWARLLDYYNLTTGENIH